MHNQVRQYRFALQASHIAAEVANEEVHPEAIPKTETGAWH